jgi:hypothetical protein
MQHCCLDSEWLKYCDSSFSQSLTNRDANRSRARPFPSSYAPKDFSGDQLQIIWSALSFKLRCLENLRYDTHATSIQIRVYRQLVRFSCWFSICIGSSRASRSKDRSAKLMPSGSPLVTPCSQRKTTNVTEPAERRVRRSTQIPQGY